MQVMHIYLKNDDNEKSKMPLDHEIDYTGETNSFNVKS